MTTIKWVEETNNPLPQVVVYSAPEAVVIPMTDLGIGKGGNDGTRENEILHSVHVGDDAASTIGVEKVSRLWNWKAMIGICIGLLTLAIVVPLTVTLSIKNHTSGPGNAENLATSTATSSSPSSTATSLTLPPAPSSTLKPIPECVKSKFIREVNWIGIDEGGGGWVFNLHPAKSAQDCCTICHLGTPDGCNGWLYIPEISSTPSCSIIHGFDGPSDSESCPKGHPDIVFTKTGDKDSYGGPGPCSGSVRG
ncbi:hypothetical protein CPAR01_10739 [Colletotrichum paranaense]|uniref:Uncharacterized protein n=1 Tax=Colletotrichum paranaense TaxID=1914294 RepID=A0ABQ9SF43_9PEZI|nr:uncharacterized protein CPAR01_10739 [Colletotrichum paranaense]KAK1534031.1 hypothetical protein CPAR01_10739 [Colletotrichum paranaense]